jgi:hypothetical protein
MGTSISQDERYTYSYQATAGANKVISATPAFLHAIILGKYVANGILEVSDHATDGDGAVKIMLTTGATDTSACPKTILVDAQFTAGITADIANLTDITFIYKN